LRGEFFAYAHIKKEYPDAEVTWVNMRGETGLPYDVHVAFEDKTELFVEVKSTMTRSRRVFEISWRELCLALDEGSRFCVYRVFGVQPPFGHLELVKISDVRKLLAAREIQILLSF